jgi:hypothetical protein
MRWILLVGVLVAVAGAWRRRRRHHDRQRKLMLLCEAVGLEFAPLDPSLDTAWLPFELFGKTSSGTENVVWDGRRNDGVRVFDYWYREERDDRPLGRRRTVTCATIPLGFACPRIRVAPRDVVDDVADAALGLPLVRLELGEFNRRFRVEAEDARSASAFLDQRMMSGFLRLPHSVVADVNEQTLLLWAPALLPPQGVLQLLQAASAIGRDLPRVMASLFPPRAERGPHERRWLQGRWSAEPTGTDAANP